MDAATLAEAMACPIARANTYVSDFNIAMIIADCRTVNRAAMFCAQVGHESLGLRYMEEIHNGSNYEGRRDLGNTVKGDGRRFKGRGPIQLTGRNNYAAFGRWARGQGLVADANYFINHPAQVATSRWGFLAAAYYWTVARGTRINEAADRRDVTAATKLINGGTNGLADRRQRWNRCIGLGTRLLPVDTRASTARESGKDVPRVRKDEGIVIPLQLPATPPPSEAQAKDSSLWPWVEEVVDLGYVGGWHGRCILRASVGHPGGRIFRAHFDVAAGPQVYVHGVPGFDWPGRWLDPAHKAKARWYAEAPTGPTALMITYAAPGGLSLSLEWEH